jgi:hypothetical protein
VEFGVGGRFEHRDYTLRCSIDELLNFMAFRDRALAVLNVFCRHDAESSGVSGSNGREKWRNQIDETIMRAVRQNAQGGK